MCYIHTNFLLLGQSNLVNTDTEGAVHVESVRITEQVEFRQNVRAYFLPWIKESVLTNKLSVLKGQVHGSAHAHLSKYCFSAATGCVIYASNMIMS